MIGGCASRLVADLLTPDGESVMDSGPATSYDGVLFDGIPGLKSEQS